MTTYKLYVVNKSSIPLVTVGKQAAEVTDFEEGLWIQPNTKVLVGTYHAEDSGTWGWIELGTHVGKKELQIYFEKKGSTFYKFFGWYDSSRSERNGNPSPFPDGVASAVLGDDEIRYEFEGVQVDHHLKLFETVWKHSFGGDDDADYREVSQGGAGEPQCDFKVDGKQVLVALHIHNGCDGPIKVTMKPYLDGSVIQKGCEALVHILVDMKQGDAPRAYEIGGFYVDSGTVLPAAVRGRSRGPARPLPDPKFTITRSG